MSMNQTNGFPKNNVGRYIKLHRGNINNLLIAYYIVISLIT